MSSVKRVGSKQGKRKIYGLTDAVSVKGHTMNNSGKRGIDQEERLPGLEGSLDITTPQLTFGHAA